MYLIDLEGVETEEVKYTTQHIPYFMINMQEKIFLLTQVMSGKVHLKL